MSKGEIQFDEQLGKAIGQATAHGLHFSNQAPRDATSVRIKVPGGDANAWTAILGTHGYVTTIRDGFASGHVVLTIRRAR